MDTLQRIVRLRDLPNFVGLKRTAIKEEIKAGRFPKPIPLNDGRRRCSWGWLEGELLAWQAERLAAREAKKK